MLHLLAFRMSQVNNLALIQKKVNISCMVCEFSQVDQSCLKEIPLFTEWPCISRYNQGGVLDMDRGICGLERDFKASI